MIEGTFDGLTVYEQSVVTHEGTTYFLAQDTVRGDKLLGVKGDATGFAGERLGDTLLCALT